MSELISYGFLTPPTILLLLGLVAGFFAWWMRDAAVGVTFLCMIGLYAAAMPIVATWLLARAESVVPAGSADLAAAQAIVVLGGDVDPGDGLTAPDTLGPLSLERVVFAARAYKALQLPVALSGGYGEGSHATAAALMRTALEDEFGVPVTWTEDRSRTTFENAVETGRLLRLAGINTVVIVTQAWHMPRALWAFRRVGLRALPWPAPRTYVRYRRVDDYLPSAHAFHDSYRALHEMIGTSYYQQRY